MTPPAQDDLIWTGSYTADGGGRADGIGALAAHGDGSLEWLGTAVNADSPSFLAVHPASRWPSSAGWSGLSAARVTLDWNHWVVHSPPEMQHAMWQWTRAAAS